MAGARYDHRLDGTLEYRPDGVVCLRFKLVDKSDETVIWSRTLEAKPEDSVTEIEQKVILELATAIVPRFGIIWSHERARHLAADVGDPRYRAMIEAGDSFRAFDPLRAQDELERLTALDPSFAAGLSYLAAIEAVAYVHGFTDPNDALALDRALKFARRGVELKPHSAFAYHILFVVLFFRGETEAARAAAENAIALNPYDLAMRADYGGRLIFAGELDQGMDILRDTAPFGAILPSWTHFYLFLGHYLRDELAEARFHAGQLTNDTHIYGQLARALMAHRDGQANEARRTIQAITSAQPHWKADPRREIGKLITGNALADRLARELVDAGLT